MEVGARVEVGMGGGREVGGGGGGGGRDWEGVVKNEERSQKDKKQILPWFVGKKCWKVGA